MPPKKDEYLEYAELPNILDREGKIHIIPVGGCGEFGMNMTLYVTSDQVILVDAGVLFPEARKIGLSGIMPNLDELLASLGGLTAYVLTHGHMDHIGAMPYLLSKWEAPVILGPWTNALLERKLSQVNLLDDFQPKILHPGQSMMLSETQLTFFPVNHSIPDSCSLIVEAEGRRVFHSGDFKFDETPVGESPIDLDELKKIGDSGVDVLISDSTGSQNSGMCPSESITIEPLSDLISKAKGRVFISTFSSNLWRIMTVLELAKKHGRRVYVDGRGFESTINIALSLGRLKVDMDLFVSPEELSSIEDDELLVISTGSQGERRASLHRISYGEHRYFEPDEDDLFIFSSRMIPGNERTIQHLIARLEKYGARIVTQKTHRGIHVSGHAFGGELEELLKLVRPKFYLPVHGTHSQLLKNCELGLKDTVSAPGVFEVEDGQVYCLSEGGLDVLGRLKTAVHYIDGDSNKVIEPETYNRRYKIGELGGAVLSGVVSSETGSFIEGPEIEYLGIEEPPTSGKNSWTKLMLKELRKKVKKDADEFELAELREFCRIFVRRKLAESLNKKPVVISKIFVV